MEMVVENDELKKHEERDSDAGDNEVVSSVHLHPFTRGSYELETRDESPPVQSIASETEGGNGDNLDGTVETVSLEIMEEVNSESNSVEVLKVLTTNRDYKSLDDDSPGNEHESKTDEKLKVAPEESVGFEEAADSLLSRESAAEVNDAVENSLIHVTTENVVENTEDSETMLNISSKVEETAIETLDDSTPIVEQDEKPVSVSESSIARSIDLVENTKELESPETSQKNQQVYLSPPLF